MRTPLLFVFVAQVVLGQTPAHPKVLSVCDILADDPTKLNGSVIAVRGVLGGTDEGTWLTGECKTHLVTKGLEWANALSVYIPMADENVARSSERMRRKLKRMHADPSEDNVWVTIIGRLETRQSMDDEVVQMPYGLARAGFGHLSGAAAEINVLSFEDVAVEKAQSRIRGTKEPKN